VKIDHKNFLKILPPPPDFFQRGPSGGSRVRRPGSKDPHWRLGNLNSSRFGMGEKRKNSTSSFNSFPTNILATYKINYI
jgi:hypothetical protein